MPNNEKTQYRNRLSSGRFSKAPGWLPLPSGVGMKAGPSAVGALYARRPVCAGALNLCEVGCGPLHLAHPTVCGVPMSNLPSGKTDAVLVDEQVSVPRRLFGMRHAPSIQSG